MCETEKRKIFKFVLSKNDEIMRISVDRRRDLMSKIMKAAFEVGYTGMGPATYIRIGKTGAAMLGTTRFHGLRVIVDDTEDGYQVGNDEVAHGGGY